MSSESKQSNTAGMHSTSVLGTRMCGSSTNGSRRTHSQRRSSTLQQGLKATRVSPRTFLLHLFKLIMKL